MLSFFVFLNSTLGLLPPRIAPLLAPVRKALPRTHGCPLLPPDWTDISVPSEPLLAHINTFCKLCKFAPLFSMTSRIPLSQPFSFHDFASLPGVGIPPASKTVPKNGDNQKSILPYILPSSVCRKPFVFTLFTKLPEWGDILPNLVYPALRGEPPLPYSEPREATRHSPFSCLC